MIYIIRPASQPAALHRADQTVSVSLRELITPVSVWNLVGQSHVDSLRYRLLPIGQIWVVWVHRPFQPEMQKNGRKKEREGGGRKKEGEERSLTFSSQIQIRPLKILFHPRQQHFAYASLLPFPSSPLRCPLSHALYFSGAIQQILLKLLFLCFCALILFFFFFFLWRRRIQ